MKFGLRFSIGLVVCLLLGGCDQSKPPTIPPPPPQVPHVHPKPQVLSKVSIPPSKTRTELSDLDQWSNLWSEPDTPHSRSEIFRLFRLAIEEKPEIIVDLLRASKPGGLREGLLAETSFYAPIAETLQVFDTLSSELTERERHILTSKLMVRTKGVGNDSQAYWLTWSASKNNEFKTAVGRALAQSLDSDADIPDALRLASGGDGPTIWRAFRQIGEANPTKAWETAANFAESERRNNAQLGVLTAITGKEGYKFALEFVRSSSSALDVPLLNLSLVSEWLEKSPIDASDWVNKNGHSSKGLYMAVSKYCEKQGDIEAARIWAEKAKSEKTKHPNR